jgi:hypothetical protein
MYITPADRQRWILTLATLGLSLVGDSISALFGLGWTAASLLAAALLTVYSLYLLVTRDPVIGRLMLFGLVVGFGELPADAFGVTTTRTLVYWPGGPFIWDTPLYMPLSWLSVIAQLGFIGAYLVPRWGARNAAIAMAIFGGINIPIYEFLAKFAHFWYYQNTPLLLGVTPYYVILAEALLSMSLPLLCYQVISARPGKIVLLGLVQSLWIYIAGRIAYALLG